MNLQHEIIWLVNDLSKLKVLHVTPHLGGGVGRCLSTISQVKFDEVNREFLLLESPVDRSFYDVISQKHKIRIVNYQNDIEQYLQTFDIIQCEFWNHPAMLHFLNYSKNIRLRRIFWCHISGLGDIRFPLNFLNSDNKIIFTSEISNAEYRTRNPVVNSGFVFAENNDESTEHNREYDFVYAGQLDYRKLHAEFTNIILQAATLSQTEVNILGDGRDRQLIQKKISSDNVIFHGHVNNVRDYFSRSKFLIYPLNEEHYGTGENIIKEAMSQGCVPLLLSNPAEVEIMKEHSSFLCHKSVGCLVQSFYKLIKDDALVEHYSNLLKRFSEHNYSVKLSVDQLAQVYTDSLGAQTPGLFEMQEAFGGSPMEWHEAFGNHQETSENKNIPSKGSRAHFEQYFSQGEAVLGVNYGR
jgi:glycosyltransferase involved in cell wall biosynthesis